MPCRSRRSFLRFFPHRVGCRRIGALKRFIEGVERGIAAGEADFPDGKLRLRKHASRFFHAPVLQVFGEGHPGGAFDDPLQGFGTMRTPYMVVMRGKPFLYPKAKRYAKTDAVLDQYMP